MSISCECPTLVRLDITKRSVSFAFNSADSDPDSRRCGTSQASPRVSHFPLTKTRFRCIRFLFLTSGYRTSLWSLLPIRGRPGTYLLPGNEAKSPGRCALCWTRLLLDLADPRNSIDQAKRYFWAALYFGFRMSARRKGV